jgi:hypothetical protein
MSTKIEEVVYTHPSAMKFLRTPKVGVFQQPRLLASVDSDYFRFARDPPGIGIRQPSFDFRRHSFGEVIQIYMLS